MNEMDLQLLKEAENWMQQGRWQQAKEVLQRVSPEGQDTLEFQVQECAILEAAGKLGAMEGVARRLTREDQQP